MRRNFSAFAAFLCMSLIVSSCKTQTGQMPATQYKTMTISTTEQVLTERYAASIKGRQDINIFPQVSGTLTKLCVSEGEVVKKGQTLFIIDQVPYTSALSTAEANVQAAKASVATAQLTADSRKTLFDKKVVSSFDMQTAQNALLTAKAQLVQAEAQLINARNNLSYTIVKSPSDGVVGSFPYRVGALVGPSIPQALTVISDNSEMYVYFSINENQLLSYTQEYGSMEKAIADMPAIKLVLNNGSEYAMPGKIESISGVIDAQTGSAMVRSTFPNEGRLLHSGSSGTVVVPHTHKDCIVIPQTATVSMQDKYIVYKVVDGKAVSCLITVAPINNGTTYVVTSGLNVGDVIIAEGAGLVREGSPVK